MIGEDINSTRLGIIMEEDEEASILAARFKKEVLELDRERWVARVIYMSASIDIIVSEIQESTVVEAKDKLGTACWVLENKDGKERIVGLVEVYGYDYEHNVYRSKFVDLFRLVVAVSIIQKIGDVNDGKVEIRCDELSAL